MITFRYQLKDVTIKIAEAAFKSGNTSIPAGSFIVPASAAKELKPAATQLGLDAVALTSQPSVATHPAELPRVAIFSTWGGTQDVGWVRYTPN